MSFKIDPPFPEFMQNGLNPPEELTGKIEIEAETPTIVQDKVIKTKEAYKIQPLFWLLNSNIGDEKRDEKHAMFCTLSFNLDFGNLRVEFYNISKDTAIQKNIVFLSELDRLVNATIYQSTCFQICNSDICDVYAMEQLITYTGEEWQKNRPICHIQKNKTTIRVSIQDDARKLSYYYDFVNHQKDIFNYACRYAVTTGMQLVGMTKIK